MSIYEPKLCTITIKQVLVYNFSLETKSAYIIDRWLQDAMLNKGQKGGKVIHERILDPCCKHMFMNNVKIPTVMDRVLNVRNMFLHLLQGLP